MTLWLCTIFPSLMKITHELGSKQSVGAASAPVTCMRCDTWTWLAAFSPAPVATERPSMTAAPAAKVNELSGNYSGPAKFPSLQVCLHLKSCALSIGGWSMLRAPFHRNYNDSAENATWAPAQKKGFEKSLLEKWVKFYFVLIYFFNCLTSIGVNV